tara:strand:+ start:2542 stop:2919 length:378 start_codon:yes stop_codon:yes gene_type:complete
MSTIKVNNIQTASGGSNSTPEQLEKGRAKAWIRFNGTGTPSITDSFNISSISEVDDGQNIISFSTAFANANYIGVPTASSGDNGMFTLMHSDFLATGSCRIITRENRTTSRTGVVYTACAFFVDG